MLKACKVVLDKHGPNHKCNEIPITHKMSSKIANKNVKAQKILKKAHGNKIKTIKKLKFIDNSKKKVILMRKDERIIAVVFKKNPNDVDFNTVLNHLIQKYRDKEPEENHVFNTKLNDFTSISCLNSNHDQSVVDFSINSIITPNNGNSSDNQEAKLEQKQTLTSVTKENNSVCFTCNNCLSGKCQTHGNPMEKLKKTHAVLSLPRGMVIQESSIPNAGLGVFALSVFEQGSLFGKMEGEMLNEIQYHARENKAYVWEVFSEEDKKVLHYLDCQDETKSDWMRFVNCARFEEEQNLIAEQYGDSIYYKAYKKINIGEELLVWYGNAYGNELREMFVPSLIPSLGASEKNLSSSNADAHGKKLQIAVKNQTANNRLISSSFKCQNCSSTFSDKLYLQSHIRAFHTTIKSYSCSSCFRKFARADNLFSHISAVHEKISPLVCNICNRCFKQPDWLEEHLKLHCERCGLLHNDDHSLRKHLKYCHPMSDGDPSEDNLNIFCDGCDKTFINIKRHFRVIHKKKIPSKCAVCGDFYVNLGSHMAKHKIKLEPTED